MLTLHRLVTSRRTQQQCRVRKVSNYRRKMYISSKSYLW